MGRFTEVIEADAQRDADAAAVEATTADAAGRDPSPFMMDYETESYALDAEATDQILTLLVAATNLL